MSQRTLEGKTDCRKEARGKIQIRMTPAAREKFPELCDGIKEVHRKYPCVKISVNGKKLTEESKDFTGGAS
jgi:hypothetical protein